MFNKEFWKWFIEFWNGNFQDTFSLWGLKADQANALNWHHIELWIIFFIIFSILMVRLLGKSKLIEKLSKHILPLSLFVWIGGVVVYIIGFYNSGVNGLSVVLRAILSSFKMFVVSHDLARIPGFLQNDASYMACKANPDLSLFIERSDYVLFVSMR